MGQRDLVLKEGMYFKKRLGNYAFTYWISCNCPDLENEKNICVSEKEESGSHKEGKLGAWSMVQHERYPSSSASTGLGIAQSCSGRLQPSGHTGGLMTKLVLGDISQY